MKLKRRDHSVPELQMASMPDLIFTVLFFFMIVTHMRENTVHVKYQEPQGTNLQKVTNKSAVIDIYIGKNYSTGEYDVQVNKQVVSPDLLTKALVDARNNISGDQMDHLCASIQADMHTPMSLVNRVKKSLREARILKVNYAGTEQNSSESSVVTKRK